MTSTILSAIGLAAAFVSAATAPAACESDRLAEVRFLVGEWEVESVEPSEPEARPRTGTSTVGLAAGGCALRESLRYSDGWEEVRLLAFDGGADEWQLALVDSEHGNMVVLSGHLATDRLEFITTHQRGETLLVDRVSLIEQEVGWLMRIETAGGYGEPWRLLQEVRYRPAG